MRESILHRAAGQFLIGLYLLADRALTAYREERELLLSWPTKDDAAEHFLILLDEIAERPDGELEQHAARIFAIHLIDHEGLGVLVSPEVRQGVLAHAGVFATAGGVS